MCTLRWCWKETTNLHYISSQSTDFFNFACKLHLGGFIFGTTWKPYTNKDKLIFLKKLAWNFNFFTLSDKDNINSSYTYLSIWYDMILSTFVHWRNQDFVFWNYSKDLIPIEIVVLTCIIVMIPFPNHLIESSPIPSYVLSQSLWRA